MIEKRATPSHDVPRLTVAGDDPKLERGPMIDICHRARARTLRRAAEIALVSSFAVIAFRDVAFAACQTLDPADVQRFTKLATAAAAAPAPSTPAMTTKELADALRKARLPQADLVAATPGTVQVSSFDFLNGGTYLKATLDGPWHTDVVQFVRQGDRLIPIRRGRAGRERVTSDVQLSVRSADSAQRYVQWLLDATSDQALWLVASVDDVPFKQPSRTEADLKAQIATLRQSLESQIEPPRAEESGTVFVVHQDAVVGRDLVRYTIKVSRLGLPTIESTTIAHELPVVYAIVD